MHVSVIFPNEFEPVIVARTLTTWKHAMVGYGDGGAWMEMVRQLCTPPLSRHRACASCVQCCGTPSTCTLVHISYVHECACACACVGTPRCCTARSLSLYTALSFGYDNVCRKWHPRLRLSFSFVVCCLGACGSGDLLAFHSLFSSPKYFVGSGR